MPASPHPADERSARYRSSVTVMAAVLDLQGRIVAVNQAWEAFGRRNGGRPEDIGLGVSYLDVCASDPDDPSAAEAARTIRSALEGRLPAPVRITTPCVSPGTTGWFDMLVSTRTDAEGAVIGATVTFSEVDPRASMPAIMRGAGIAETDAQSLVSVILACPDAVMVADGAGRVVLANERCVDVLGHEPESLVGRPVGSVVRPDGVQEWWSPRGDAVPRPFRHAPATGRRPDGSTFAAEVSRLPLVLPPGLSLVTVRAL